MPPTASRTGLPTDLIERVNALTPEQRDELFDLVDAASLPPDTQTEEEFRAELARRIADVQAGRAELLTREQADERVRAEMRKLGVEL